jgi:hypothetical protein
MPEFQAQVNTIQAPAVEGDFASANPRATVLAGEGALIAGRGVIDGVLVEGCVVGRFGWTSYQTIDNDEAPGTVNSYGSGLPQGIIHRNQQALITQWLGSASMVYNRGLQLALFNGGDYWVKNRNASAYCQVGMKAFARYSDGAVLFAAAGATPGGGSGSASSIAAGTFSGVGSISNNILTVTGSVVGANGIRAGGTIAGSGVATGTKIVSQLTPLLSGEALNGIGRYYVSIPEQSVAAGTAFTGTYGILTVGGTVVSGFGAGQTISGTNVVTDTTVYEQLTGTAGAAGTYVVDNNTVVSSTAITSADSIETKFYAKSAGAANELIKISNVQ